MNDLTHEYPLQLLKYPSRLANDHVCSSFILMDEYIFSTYFTALIQGIKVDGSNGDDALAKILTQVLPGFDSTDIDPMTDRLALDKQEALMQIVNNLRSQFSENITTTYVKDFFLSTSIYREILQVYRSSAESAKALKTLVNLINEEVNKNLDGRLTSITQNLQRLTKTIDLTQAEVDLIEMNFLFSIDVRCAIFRDFLFTVTKNASMFEYFYKVMLSEGEVGDIAIDKALSEHSKPIALGIVKYDLKTKRLPNISEFWVFTISGYAESDDKFYSRFVEELKENKQKSFSGAIAKASPVDAELLTEFLEKAHDVVEYKPDTEDSVGLNVLIYGPSRLDKIGYVTEFLKNVDFVPYKVRTRDAKYNDIPGICYIAQQHVKDLYIMNPVILVVEKAEQALTKNRTRPSWMVDMFADGELSSPGTDELDSDELLLIKNPVPTIWLTNAPSSIIPDNVGRFLFHVELRGGSRADRRGEVQKVVDELGFSPELSVKLSKYYELSVEQIKAAARAVTILDQEGIKGETSMLHLIGNSQKALDREKMEDLRDSVTKYSLDLLNLGGNMPIDKIVNALKKRPQGTMCLYGPPGTGKTQLAEYIATELDKPLLIKPASELLSMWLGESEKNIAKMFDEAKAEGAILLLDEADSFLRDRSMASKSWEVTQVNELLQRMERFQGIFICATNLMTSLDAAALRRFTFKLEFKALTNEQRLKMLVNETGIDLSTLSQSDHDSLVMELALIKHLTPGDFATVRRQSNLLDEQLDIDTWLDRLDIESKAKMLGLERNGMGFIPMGEVSNKAKGE